MKKQLLTTTAAIAMVGGAATAQEWNLDWGGYYNMDFLYNDVSGSAEPADSDFSGTSIFQNGEIHFTPNVTLDNGMTFGVVVEMEAANDGGGSDGIDESYMYMESDTMGRVEVGSENSAGYKLSTGAPSVGFGINSPSPTAFHPLAFTPITYRLNRQAMGSSYTEVAGNNDTARISYYSPSFNGFTVGVSYAPSGDTNVSNSGVFNRDTSLSDIIDIGANYSQSFGNVDMTFSARYGTGSGADSAPGANDANDPETWAVGARMSTAGFTFGGSYAENDGDTASGAGDSEGYSLGVTYDLAGPWTVGFDTYIGEATVASVAGGAAANVKDEYEAYQIGAERSLGAGVAWRMYVIQSETSRSSSDPAVTKMTAEATTVGTGIRLNF